TKVREIPNIQISPHVILGLLKIGFPIMLIGLMFILLRSVDRIIIAVLLSKQMLGYFAIGTIVSGLIYLSIADIVKVIFGPRIMENLGNTGDINLIKKYFIEPTIIIAYFTPFLVGTLYLGIHIPIKYFLAKYFVAIGVIQILVLGSFFLAIVMLPLLVCVSLNKQVNIIFLMLIAIISDAILSYTFIVYGWGLEGVAIGTGISYFILSFISLLYALKQFNVKLDEYIKLFALIYAPFLYAFCLLFILDNFIIFNTNGFWNDIFLTTLQIFIFFLMFSIVFIFFRKHMAFKKLIDSLPIPNRKTQTVLVDF
ncbi:MAG: polysaccharide biosynthesis C-terminal domain-containing protein, partial [Deltaproteobacteria bacterium]|nr:polysaccharide biosynthesis C-terminal domain-containing protein [Deltaproteobacteria bacterium]